LENNLPKWKNIFLDRKIFFQFGKIFVHFGKYRLDVGLANMEKIFFWVIDMRLSVN
jgi:hypothetical protein